MKKIVFHLLSNINRVFLGRPKNLKSASVFLFFGISLSACGPNGPKVTVCVSNPSAQNFLCHNQAQNKDLTQKPSQVDNWIFLSPADELSILTACQKRLGGVKVNVCVFSSSALAFTCFDEVTNQGNGMGFQASENWIGVSPVDEQILLTYCASIKK